METGKYSKHSDCCETTSQNNSVNKTGFGPQQIEDSKAVLFNKIYLQTNTDSN